STLDGSGITAEEAAAAAVDAIYQPDEEVIWDEEKPQEVEKIALSLHRKYCDQIAPSQTYAAVEIRCDGLQITDLGLELTGTTDRIVCTEDGYGIADIKTGKAAVGADGKVKTAGHAYQMGVYELLAEHGSGLPMTAPAEIIGLNTAKTDAAQRVGTGQIEGAREVLLGDENGQGILQMAAAIVHSGNFYGNPKSMMCHPRYCPEYPTCKFRK
uniref:PD-(D/E)XK nuclease family protein n=1 Tax=Neisseria dentiae TaxID=194197 RepID=UPI0035A1ADE1